MLSVACCVSVIARGYRGFFVLRCLTLPTHLSAWLMCYWLQLQKHCYLVKRDSRPSHQHTHANITLTLPTPLILTSSFVISRPNRFVTCFWEAVFSADCDSDLVTQRNSRCDVIAVSGQRSASLGVVFTGMLQHTQMVWGLHSGAALVAHVTLLFSPTHPCLWRNDRRRVQCWVQ